MSAAARSTKKQGGASALVDEPVMIPVFVPHHYLRLETRDGHQFVVDRNVAMMSRLLRHSLRDLYRIAVSGDDGNAVKPSSATDTTAPRDTVKPSILQETLLGGLGDRDVVRRAIDESTDVYGDENSEDETNDQTGFGGRGRRQNGDDPLDVDEEEVLFTLADGDVEVLVNSERTAVAAGQLPIVYCQASTSSMDATGGANSMQASLLSPLPPPSGKGNSKQLQQAQAAHEQAMFLQQQRAKVEEALDSMRETPLTHLRLTKLTAEQFELALRFMQYKYKVDHINDGALRQGFYGFLPGHTSYPPTQPSPNPAHGGTTSSMATSVNAASKRKSIAPIAGGVAAFDGSMVEGLDVDPVTGAGIVKIPEAFSEHHILLLAIASLLQL